MFYLLDKKILKRGLEKKDLILELILTSFDLEFSTKQVQKILAKTNQHSPSFFDKKKTEQILEQYQISIKFSRD